MSSLIRVGAAALSLTTAIIAGCTSSSGGSSPPALKWYTTCGYPLCPAPDSGLANADAGAPACTAGQQEGAACTTQGATCDANLGCGALLECSDHDPKAGGCPISSRRFKHDIAYLSEDELARVRDEALGIRLASYEYNDGDGRTRLGYILEDSPSIPASDASRSRVDLYGYSSMILATTQVQAKEIDRLKTELTALEAKIERLQQESTCRGR